MANSLQRPRSSLPAAVLITALFAGTFVFALLQYRAELQRAVRRTVVERDAAVLHPIAQRELAQEAAQGQPDNSTLVRAVLKAATQPNVFGVIVYDSRGAVLRSAPSQLLVTDLAFEDELRLLKGERISRFEPRFRLDQYFGSTAGGVAPVLEVLLPLSLDADGHLAGVAHYILDARALELELEAIDRRMDEQTRVTLAIGVAAILLIATLAYALLRRAQQALAERNERLARANFELALAAKTSALGQVTSHLLHGLQGPVAGLRGLLLRNDTLDTDARREAAAYTQRLQSLIAEAVGMLGDLTANASYELTPAELAALVRERSATEAERRGVRLTVETAGNESVESHRGSVLALIAANLIHNAVEATAMRPGAQVRAQLVCRDGRTLLSVRDNGAGIPEPVRTQLFRPGASGRPGGSGLGLAISRLLARQIGGELELKETGPHGTHFEVRVPA